MISGDIETTEKVEYEDLLKNYYEKMEIIEEQDKEIERLNKELEEKEAILGGIQQLEAEVERLNNIINELEEYICAIEYDERHSDSWQIPVRIHNKLKELKGSDKE